MSLELLDAALRSRILSDATVQNGMANRLYAQSAPPNATSPYACYTLQSEDRDPRVQGGLAKASYTIDFFSDDNTGQTDISRIVEAIRKALDTWSGDSQSVVIRRVFLKDRRHNDQSNRAIFGAERIQYSQSLDIDVWYRETAPVNA